MKPFQYLLDRLFITSCLLYAINRWVVKPHTSADLFHAWFNDLLLIPCALPPMLLLHRKLGLRSHDGPPTVGEILLHLAIWSIFCEIAGPRWLTRGTADPLDIVAYTTGALFAAIWWHRFHLPSLKSA